MTEATVNPGEALLTMRGITKRFPGVVANRDVSLTLQAGEVHALLGENGAGKSTLMKILSGLVEPDEGEIRLAGEKLALGSAREATERGIGMVHQHFMLVENLTAVENVVLGLTEGGPILDLDGASERLRELGREYEMEVDPRMPVERMPVGARQRLEILKLLFRDVNVLVLDEPTAVLTPSEARQLFRMIERLTGEGRSVIFISHKLDEVEEISDRVTVLRDGEVVDTRDMEGVTATELSRMMVGRSVAVTRRELTHHPRLGPARLRLEAVGCDGEEGRPALDGVDLEVHGGEIVGVAGVDGNGQRELAECVAGLRPHDSGRVEIDGELVEGPESDLSRLGFIPEDRQRSGLALDFSISENLILKNFREPPFSRYGVLSGRAIAANGRQQMERLKMRRSDPSIPVGTLSGGNQQRVMVGRELSAEPRVVIAAQPTRGLDIGAVDDVHDMLIDERDRGAAVLFISTELVEVLAISDRVVVMHQGEIMGEVRPDEADPVEIGEMMLGRRRTAEAEA